MLLARVKPSLRILIVEDHSLFAEALEGVLRRISGDARVTLASSAEKALDELKRSAFDLVLLDLGLPGLKGRAAFEAVRAVSGRAAVVIVSGAEPTAETMDLIRNGARGYVHKRATSDELLSVLRFVLDGGTQVPTALLSVSQPSDDAIVLTPRQREVLLLLAQGESNRDIAERLGISEATVRVHVSSVMRVLDVENRTQAATSTYARRLLDSAL